MCFLVLVFEADKLDSDRVNLDKFGACYLSFLWQEGTPTFFQRTSAIHACAHTQHCVCYLSISSFPSVVKMLLIAGSSGMQPTPTLCFAQ